MSAFTGKNWFQPGALAGQFKTRLPGDPILFDRLHLYFWIERSVGRERTNGVNPNGVTEQPDSTSVAAAKASVPLRRRRTPGQALVEYVLIVVLVSLAIIAVLTLTGPAIGTVFNNMTY